MSCHHGRLYFGYMVCPADVDSVTRRWFGAVWRYHDGVRAPVAYWIEETEEEVLGAWKGSAWYEESMLLFTPYPVHEVFQIVQRHLTTEE
ncbi:hypothetical protein [Alicyclobacillus acidiphilus]|uniref:hypothetical protein n=1 Tax=Alicyclobacillus acidiphilus TaxID=182455 RepID=UPI0008353E51|nr:hypothetical protein [Alicyclobacillus acidiphilus]